MSDTCGSFVWWAGRHTLSARHRPNGGCVMADGWSGMRGISSVPTYVVMQPTTLCNLDCSYCYLPFRKTDHRMPVGVARAVAEAVRPWSRDGRFSIVWHGGEPLAAGRELLGDLMEAFGPGVEHHVQ